MSPIDIIGLLNGSAARSAQRQPAERFDRNDRYRTIGLRGFTFVDDPADFATVADVERSRTQDPRLRLVDAVTRTMKRPCIGSVVEAES